MCASHAMENSEHRRWLSRRVLFSLGSLQQSLFVWLDCRDHNQKRSPSRKTRCPPCASTRYRGDAIPLSGVALPGPLILPMCMSHYPGSITNSSQSLPSAVVSFVFILPASAACALHGADGGRVNPRGTRKRKPCSVIRSQDMLAPVNAVLAIFSIFCHILDCVCSELTCRSQSHPADYCCSLIDWHTAARRPKPSRVHDR
jgi:hypothetical protein